MFKQQTSLFLVYFLTAGIAQAAPLTASVSDACNRTPDFIELKAFDFPPRPYLNHSMSLRYFDHNNQEIFFEFFTHDENSVGKRHHINITDFPISKNGGVVAKTVCTGLALATQFAKISEAETSITMHFEIAELPSDVKNDKLHLEAPVPSIIQLDKVIDAKKGESFKIPIVGSSYIDHIEILYHGSSEL